MKELSILIGIALASTIKFVGGPLAGIALGLNFHATAVFSAIGMMISVILVLFFGPYLKKVFSLLKPKKPKVFSKSKRFAIRVKQKLGLWGIAILTPFIFTPIVGSFLATTFKFQKKEILLKMALSGIVAGYIQTYGIFYIKEIYQYFAAQYF